MGMTKRFLTMMRPHYARGLAIMILMLAGTAFTVGTPYLYKQLIDGGVAGGRPGYVALMVALVVSAIGLRELLSLLQTRLTLRLRKTVFLELRIRLYRRLMELPPSFYADRHKGRLISRITSDVNAMQNMMLEHYAAFAQNLLAGLAIGVIVVVIDWRMAAAAVLFLPVLALLYRLFRPRLYAISKQSQEAQEEVMERLQEDLGMVRAIQAYSAEAYRREATVERLAHAEEIRRRLKFRYAAASSSTIVIHMAGLAIVWGFGGQAVIDGGMSLGTLIAVSFYLNLAVGMCYNVYYTVIGFQESLPAAKRVFELLDERPAVADRPDAVPLAGVRRRIAFEHVTFGYKGGKPVLDGVSFELRRGSVVGIVGDSGEGKTTLANLLLRFHDPDEGAVTIDGTDIRSFTLESLRRAIAVVPQEDQLFNMTIRDNILLGRTGVSEPQFEAACRRARLDAFVPDLPAGYDTPIGEQGVLLSGGQRKRIAIARALLTEPDVLIMDEATASLDEAAERDIVEAVTGLAGQCTVILITHKHAILSGADVVLEASGGRVTRHSGLNELNSRKVMRKPATKVSEI